MAVEIDHYQLLGLPSGEEGSKLTQNEISKAYRLKALELHPDKRCGDPNAHVNFQKLTSSYDILKHEKARKLFNDLLRVKRQQRQRQSQCNSKKMSDVVEKDRASFAPDPSLRAKEEDDMIKDLYELMCQAIADVAKTKSPAAILKMFNIGSDFKIRDYE